MATTRLFNERTPARLAPTVWPFAQSSLESVAFRK
jgi:hypothetical protein